MKARKPRPAPEWINFDRAVLIDVCKDGTISYRERAKREARLNDAALPVYSVDTVDEARALQVHFGAEQYTEHPNQPGREWFVLPAFTGKIEALDAVSRRFHDFYHDYLTPKRMAPPEGSRWAHRRDRRVCVFERLRFEMRDGFAIVALADYHYEPTPGSTPGLLARNGGKMSKTATPTQSMPFLDWVALFPAVPSSPARRRGAR